VVLLHAFPLDSGMWRPQIDHLAPEFRLIAPDFPGFGKSAVSAGLTIDSAADVVAELLDHLGINERVVVGGVSMGGYVSLAFARLYPQRLGALVLADTKADPDDEAARAGRDRLIHLAGEKGVNAVVEQLLPKLLGHTTIARRPQVVEKVRSIAVKQSVDGVVAASKAMRERPDAEPGLAHIAVPSQVIVGEEDVITPPVKARQLVEKIPNARLATIPGAGHLSNLENETAFNSAVREFLYSLPAEQGPAHTV